MTFVFSEETPTTRDSKNVNRRMPEIMVGKGEGRDLPCLGLRKEKIL